MERHGVADDARKVRGLAAYALALVLPVVAVAAPAAPVVRVTGGMIRGVASDDRQAVLFRGVPFAEAPLGAARWSPPRPVKSWRGVRVASARAPSCLQNDYRWNHDDHLRGREDCLTLDVRTPALSGRRPVMVWIHGGSNRAGSAGDTVLSSITKHGIVLVAIQYRLGIFGFVAPREAARESGGAAGNYGLMDQIVALRWVKANIARFGGDPDQVTIAGESAGSQDVSLLMASPQARGLFAQSIMESGTPGFGMPFRSLDDALVIGDQLAIIAGGGNGPGSLRRLRTASADALLAADRQLTDGSLQTNDYMWLKTTIDGAVLPQSPRTLLAKAPARPLLIGSNRAEFGPSAGSLVFPESLRPIFGANSDKAANFYQFGNKAAIRDPRLGHAELEFSTDWLFRCPAGRMADLVAQRGAPTWRYEFDVADGAALTSHAAELAYVFGEGRFGPGISLAEYWANFVKSGNPNGGQLPAWPPYVQSDRQHILFNADGVSRQANLRQPLCHLIDEL